MNLGKGIFIWQLWNCEGGDVNKLATKADNLGFKWVAIKIADGRSVYPQKKYFWQADLLSSAVEAFKAVGIKVWGWHFIYGYYPEREARVALDQMLKYDLDGYIIDAEAYYKGKYQQASKFSEIIRGLAQPIALCSYRYPNLHPTLPWDQFLNVSDLHMPQVYWEGAHSTSPNNGPKEQLVVSTRQLLERKMIPIVPVGSSYSRGSWIPTIEDLDEFHDTAKELSLPGISWWSWQHAESTKTPEGMYMLNVIGSQFWDEVQTPHKTVELRLAVNPNDNMNIRSEPRVEDNKVGLLPAGAEVPVLNEVRISGNIWFKIGWDQYIASEYQGRKYMQYVRE